MNEQVWRLVLIQPSGERHMVLRSEIAARTAFMMVQDNLKILGVGRVVLVEPESEFNYE